MAKATLLLITDISGFTRFVSSHSQEEGVRTAREMLNIILRSNNLKLNLCEIEGDAVFFYSDNASLSFKQLGEQIRKTFRRFNEYLREKGLADQLGIKIHCACR